MSDLDTRPPAYVCGTQNTDGLVAPEELLLTARKVWLGKTSEVARALPDKQIRMIGAWCFLDHYGPEDITASPGMRVWAHPHTGLQTVSWLFDGEIEHRDGLGSQVTVRPGALHVMTAGHGIVHTEMSPLDKPPMLHGVQLWVALPAASRDDPPAFESHHPLPALRRPGLGGTVLVGELDSVRSPATGHTPLCGADCTLAAGAAVELQIEPGFEYGVFVAAGQARVEHTDAGVDQLVYLGGGRSSLRLTSDAGARVVILGGEPFEEEVVMWWNFLGRSHEEVAEFREAWLRRDARFAPVVSREEKVLEAPAMPTVPLRPRPRRRPR